MTVLAKNSGQFETLLQSLDDLSTQGRSLLETYYPQIVTQLQTLQAVSSQLSQHQTDLASLLSQIPLADNALPQAVRSGYVQLYENIIVCGIPAGGEDDNSPAFSSSWAAPIMGHWISMGGELRRCISCISTSLATPGIT